MIFYNYIHDLIFYFYVYFKIRFHQFVNIFLHFYYFINNIVYFNNLSNDNFMHILFLQKNINNTFSYILIFYSCNLYLLGFNFISKVIVKDMVHVMISFVQDLFSFILLENIFRICYLVVVKIVGQIFVGLIKKISSYFFMVKNLNFWIWLLL